MEGGGGEGVRGWMRDWGVCDGVDEGECEGFF